MSDIDYLAEISLIREEIEGQAILDAISRGDPDVEYIEKQRRKIAKYNAKIGGD